MCPAFRLRTCVIVLLVVTDGLQSSGHTTALLIEPPTPTPVPATGTPVLTATPASTATPAPTATRTAQDLAAELDTILQKVTEARRLEWVCLSSQRWPDHFEPGLRSG